MDVPEIAVTILRQYAVDYEGLLSTARSESSTNIVFFLRQHLPFLWRDLYVAAVPHPTNIVRFQCRTFEYFYDLYSELEVTGEVPYDQTIEDRVVGVLGTSACADEPRDGNRMRGWGRSNGGVAGHKQGQGTLYGTLHRRWT